jgi:pyruvate/2-oxoglutarate dehydrogenase complex dihydrolipoamide acyltransferase (E2) component
MSQGTAPSTPDVQPRPRSGRRRWIPFWVLQLTELAVAFIFVDISVHVGNSGLLVGAAVAVAALAVTAHGPLGILRICRPRLHVTLLIAVAAAVAVAPVLPGLRPDIEGIIVIEFGAVGLIRLATLTDTHPSSRSGRSSPSARRDRTVIDATATATDATAAASTATPVPNGSPGADSRTGAAARWAGRAAGVASVSGRRAVAKHGPEAEAQVKRAIRGAGRWTGRLTSPPDGESGGPTDR